MIATFIIYLVIVLVIGTLAERFVSKSEKGFYLGDRRFGPFTTAISAGATDSSGWQFIGAVGYAYAFGISAMWMLPGIVLGYLFNWVFIAPRLQKFGIEHEVLNLSDYWEKRFNDKSHLLKRTSGVIISLFFIAYMASQLSAAGITFETIFNLDFKISILISVVFVLSYTIMGGYISVIWTDFIQGMVMLGVLLIAPIVLILYFWGFPEFFQTIQAIDPILVSYGGGEVGAVAFGVIIGLFGIGFAYPGQPQLLQRFLSARDEKTIRQGTYISVIWAVVIVAGSNLIGLIARILLPSINDPEYAFPTLAMDLFPAVIGGIVIAAIFAAIQSTFSSQLMVATQSIATDIIKTISKKKYTNKQNVTMARVIMLVLSILATVIALLNIETVFHLTLYAFAGLGASFGPLLILSLTTDKVTVQGAFWGMILGTVVTVIWKLSPYSVYLYEIIPGIIFSVMTILLVSKWTYKKSSNENLS